MYVLTCLKTNRIFDIRSKYWVDPRMRASQFITHKSIGALLEDVEKYITVDPLSCGVAQLEVHPVMTMVEALKKRNDKLNVPTPEFDFMEARATLEQFIEDESDTNVA